MDWLNTITQGVLLGSLYALYGIGLSLSFGVMRLVNLAHGDLIVCAAYLALLLTQIAGIAPIPTLIVVVPAMFGLGVLLQRGLLNRVIGKGPMPPLLITFGISIILVVPFLAFLLDLFFECRPASWTGRRHNPYMARFRSRTRGLTPV